MHLLPSEWLQRLVKKSSPSPEQRLIKLFDILQDWIDAPGLRDQWSSSLVDHVTQQQLNVFIVSLASDAKLTDPHKIAFQLSFILLGALHEELRNPGCQAILHAREAAIHLIAAEKKTLHVRSYATPALAASLAIVLSMSVWFIARPTTAAPSVQVFAAPPHAHLLVSAAPDQLSNIYRMHDRLRAGQCSYPQALMLAPEQRAVFLEGVVNIEDLNTATADLNEVSRLYQKVNCSYAPAAMLL